MADFDKPTLDDTYVNVLPDIRLNQAANALMFNGVTVSNIPAGAIQYAGGVFGTWNGASFDVTPVVIGGGGTGATTAAGARANLDLYSTSESDAIHMSITANGSDINDASIFRTNIDVYSTSESDAITGLSLLKTDNLASVASASTSFDNIKQSSTETSEGVVEKATAAEMRAGTADKFPDAATIAADRVPVSIWTGADFFVTPAEIFANTGFTVSPGVYFIVTSAMEYTINIRSISSSITGTSGSALVSTNIRVTSALFNITDFSVIESTQGDASSAVKEITQIFFTPL